MSAYHCCPLIQMDLVRLVQSVSMSWVTSSANAYQEQQVIHIRMAALDLPNVHLTMTVLRIQFANLTLVSALMLALKLFVARTPIVWQPITPCHVNASLVT